MHYNHSKRILGVHTLLHLQFMISGDFYFKCPDPQLRYVCTSQLCLYREYLERIICYQLHFSLVKKNFLWFIQELTEKIVNYIVTKQVDNVNILFGPFSLLVSCLIYFRHDYKSSQQDNEKNWHYDQKDDPQEVRDDGEQDFFSILTLSTGRQMENCIKAEVPRCH